MQDRPKIQSSIDEFLSYETAWSTFRGTLYATAVAKATATFSHGKLAEMVTPEPIQWREALKANGNILHAEEASPFMPGGQVLVTGFIYAYGATRGKPALARVAVGVDRIVVDKTVGTEFNGKIPITWEEALRAHDNPVGSEDPRIVNVREPMKTVGMGPIATHWGSRVALLGAPLVRESDVLLLPSDFDARYFFTAPIDQQCPPFTGAEAIVLEGMRPNVATLQTWLPSLQIRARAGIDGHPQRIDFTLDTIAIDAEQCRMQLLWRAPIAIPPGSRVMAIQVQLDGQFDRTKQVVPEPVRETRAPAEVAPPPPPPPPPPAPKKERPPLSRVGDPKKYVLDCLAKKHPIEDVDLTGVNLESMALSGVSFSHSKLDGANFRGAKLDGANLEKTSLDGANFENAKLDGAKLDGANLSNVKASRCSLIGASLVGAKLVLAQLEKATLDDADLADADATRAILTEAKLRRAKANRAKFERAMLVTADLADASLDFASLERCSLDDANFKGASLADANLTQCVGTGANMTKARLVRANMTKARLVSAIFTGADLSTAAAEEALFTSARFDGANLDHFRGARAKFTKADFTRATVVEADFQGADLSNATLLSVAKATANLRGAIVKGIVE